MRSEWASDEDLRHVFAALTPANRLACMTSLETGLRIGDVLALHTADLKNASGRVTVHEQKTGKARRVYFPAWLRERLLSQAGHTYVFPHRTDGRLHRTRQSVFKDIRRAAKAFRLTAHISPHSLRKAYAVDHYHKTGSMKKVKELLGHADEAVTAIYALADCMPRVRKKKRTG